MQRTIGHRLGTCFAGYSHRFAVHWTCEGDTSDELDEEVSRNRRCHCARHFTVFSISCNGDAASSEAKANNLRVHPVPLRSRNLVRKDHWNGGKVRAIAVTTMLGTSIFLASSAMAMPPQDLDDYICIQAPFSGDWICFYWPF